MAAQLGATHLINSQKSSPEKEILKIIGTQGADVVIDNTGNTDVISLAYKLTQSTGRTILVGVPHVNENISIHSLPLHFGKTITGSHGGESNPTVDIPSYIRLYNAGKLHLDELITDTFSLAEINLAIDKMRQGKITGRCLLEINP